MEMELSLNSLNSKNSTNLINRGSMNQGHFKYHVCFLCLGDSVEVSLSLTQEVAGLITLAYKIYCH